MRAFTLVELIVALAVMGAGLAVVGLSVQALRPSPEALLLGDIAAARDSAIRSGEPVEFSRARMRIRFAPDGSASVAGARAEGLVIRVDPLNGAVRLGAR